ncbi:hypothetical protein JHK86_015984 [Glycine max]|nr:hypothetical protein JHK86_015984 [Glycine max]
MNLQHQAPPPLVVLEAREFSMSYNAYASDSSHLPFNFQIYYIGVASISYQIPEFPQLSEERILCIGSNSKRPVLKWENNMAWPGKLTLTDKAIYFEVAWEALSRVIISVPKEALPSYIKLVRDAVSTSRDKERRKKKGGPILIPGFCLPEALQPILPIFLQVLFFSFN